MTKPRKITDEERARVRRIIEDNAHREDVQEILVASVRQTLDQAERRMRGE